MKPWIAGTLALSLLFAGCASTGPKEGAGTVIGGVGGAIIGSQIGGGTGQIVATAVGAIAGAMIGQSIGKSLDKADRLEMERTAQYSLENSRVNETTAWRNPDSGNSGSITPTRTSQAEGGKYCREYRQTVVIDGKEEQAYGTACRQPDGSWVIVQ
jgi:surface antigen